MNISYHSFLPHLGYGVAAAGYVELLKANPANAINWTAHRFENEINQPLTREFTQPNDLNFIHLTPDYIPRAFDERCPNVANTVFESTRLPAEWLPHLNRVDRVAVPCTWNQAVFEESLKKPVYLLPHLSQFSGQPPATTDGELQLPADRFMFLTVGTWELRKNLAQVVDTYCRVFSKKDPVLLVIKTSENDLTLRHYQWRHFSWRHLNWQRVAYWQQTTKTLRQLMRFRPNAPAIQLLPTPLTDQAMQHLYHRCDAYVTLTNGEGWGLGAYEAAWFGKPVIATGFGGYLDFLKPNTAFLTPYQLIPYKQNPWDDADRSTHYYAQPDLSSAAEYMRFVYNAPDESKQRGRRLSEYVQQQFSRSSIAARLQAFIQA